MKISFIDEKWLKDEVRKVIFKYLPSSKYKAFFFGSRVKGNNFERSDIDLGVEGPEPVSADVKLEIIEALEDIPTLYFFDLVDFSKASASFKKHAMQHVEYLN